MKKKKKKIVAVILLAAVAVTFVILAVRVGREETVTSRKSAEGYDADADYKQIVVQEYLGKDEEETLEKIYKDVLGMTDPQKEMGDTTWDTADGYEYNRSTQMYEGVPVYGRSTVICRDGTSGALDCITSNYISIETDMTCRIEKDEAEELAKKWFIKEYDAEEARTSRLTELSVYTMADYRDRPRLCWKISVGGTGKDGIYRNQLLFLDAKKGKYVASFEQTYYFQSPYIAYGQEMDAGLRTITVDFENGIYTMKNADDGRFVYLPTTSGNSEWRYDSQDGKKLIQWAPQEEANPSAVDAMYQFNIIQGYFQEKFGRKTMKKNGDEPNEWTIVVNADTNYDEHTGEDKPVEDNACFTQSLDTESPMIAFFKCGDENEPEKPEYTNSLVICAHEYVHGIIKYEANLLDDEKGKALNEAISDIIGSMLRNSIYPEQPSGQISPSRNIENPDKTQFFTNMDQWNKPPEGVQLGENAYYAYSTILSHAAYTAFLGSDAFQYKKEETAIDADTMIRLWYHAIQMLPSDATYEQCRTIVEYCGQRWLTEAQQAGLSWAFDQAKIKKVTTALRAVDGSILGEQPLYNEIAEASAEDTDTQQVNTKDLENYSSNLGVGGKVSQDGEWIYYVGGINRGYLWKMKEDGTSKIQLTQEFVSQIAANDGYVYYIKDDKTFWRMNGDSGIEERISGNGQVVSKFTLDSQYIQYTTEQDECIWLRQTGNSGTMEQMPVPEQIANVKWKWCVSENWYYMKENSLYRCDFEGEGEIEIVNLIQDKILDNAFAQNQVGNFQISNGDLFFTVSDIETKAYRLSMRENSVELLNPDYYIGSCWVYDGELYYLGEGGIYKYDPGTGERQFFGNGNALSFSPYIWGITENWIYIKGFAILPQSDGEMPLEIDQVERIKQNGTDKEVFLELDNDP